MSLPDPPETWLTANGYVGWISDERRRQARAAYAYEREHGPPPEPFPEGTTAHRQWTYKGGDPLDLAKGT